jgi:GxxExxY protein
MQIEQLNDLAYRIIGAGIEVHRGVGPGLLESTYRTCMVYELRERGMNVVGEQRIPVRYKSLTLDGNYRIDLLVEDTIIVELKSVEFVLPPSRSGSVLPSSHKQTARPANELQRCRSR